MSPVMVPKSGASSFSILYPLPSSVPENPSIVVHPEQSMSAPSSTTAPGVASAVARSVFVETVTADADKARHEAKDRIEKAFDIFMEHLLVCADILAKRGEPHKTKPQNLNYDHN